MEVATEMFVHQGFAATTLLDIAKRAGVATRTLYQHFGDKEALFRDVIFARDAAVVEPPVLQAGEDLKSALRRIATYSYEVALRPKSIELMRLMIAESGRFPEMMGKVANTIFLRFKANVSTVFRQLADAGLIPQDNHDESASLFVDLLLGNQTVMIYFGWVSATPSDQEIDLKIDLFVRGRFGLEEAPRKPVRKRTKV